MTFADTNYLMENIKNNNPSQKRRNICLVASYAPSLINFRGPLLKELVNLGHRVNVIAPSIDGDLQASLFKLGVKCHLVDLSRKGLNPFSDIKFLLQLVQIFKKTKCDTVITYTIKPNIFGAFASALVGARSISMITGLGYAFSKEGNKNSKSKLALYFARLLLKFSTKLNWRVIFQNRDDLADFCEAGCLIDASKARLVNGSGVDLNFFSFSNIPQEPVFLMISRLLGEKGVREYALAAIETKKQYPNSRFLLAGFFDNGGDAISKKEVEQWTSEGVEFVGSLEDVRPTIREASVYVLPSYREGTPRTVLEAMAMGRAVITTDAPGCRETVIENKTGYLVPVGDVPSLVEKMKLLIERPKLRKNMGLAGLNFVKEKYDVNKVNEVLLGHLEL